MNQIKGNLSQLHLLQMQIAPLRQQLANHNLYAKIQSQAQLQYFMENHIFAVWDFMSLLKYLQNHLTCTNAPWTPKSTAELRFFINEIVLGEESDTDPMGGHISHFELYKRAMSQAGASASLANDFIATIEHGRGIREALNNPKIPKAAAQFVGKTFDIIENNKLHEVAAAFAFGREDLIPDMFLAMVKGLNANVQGEFDTFIYYLQRHIELDGDHHAGLAALLLKHVCGDNETKWIEATAAAKLALNARIDFWDQISESIHTPVTEVNELNFTQPNLQEY